MTRTDKVRKHPAQKGIRSKAIGILVIALLALSKGVAGFLGNSYALIAEGGN